MALPKRYAKKQAKAKERQRQNAKARHQRQQQDAQRYINAIHQALMELGLPDHLVLEIEGRLKAQKKLLGKIFGLMFPTLFGATSTYELTRARGWDKNLPSRILEALPKRSWLKRLRKPRPRHPRAPLASHRVDECGHPKSLAVELGMG